MVHSTEPSGDGSDAELLTSVRGPPAEAKWCEPGGMLGRYRVVEPIGKGGMGAVYLARDDQLDRNIAIKVLGRRRRGLHDAARLQREAQAMARLNHENVATVFEVGTHASQVFVAMEYIDGVTLRAWLKDGRPWPDVLEHFVRAGRALAAAHEVGLVHRDFKPANVMVSREGRVVVLDFGLARDSGEGSSDGAELSTAERSDGTAVLLEADLTETGALLGTPAYMSPEGFDGRRLGPAADQFSLCVALFEALYGGRPFEGENFMQLRSSVCHGAVRRVGDRHGVPRALHRTIMRGLARDPRSRWPSMRALLVALGDRSPSTRSRWVAAAAAVSTVAVVAVLTLDGAAGVCDSGAERASAVWNDAQRVRLREGLVVADARLGPEAAAGVEAHLDAYLDRWTDAYSRACEGAQRANAAPLDDRMRCLAQRLVDVTAVVDALAEGGEGVAARALPAVVRISPAQACLDGSRLDRFALPEDPGQARAVLEVRARLARTTALARTGRYAEALEVAEAAAEAAEATGHAAVIAAATLHVGSMKMRVGDYDASAPALERAFTMAVEIGEDEFAAKAAVQLVHLHGDVRRETQQALKWARHGRPLVERSGDGELVGQLESALASVYLGQADYDLAQTHARQAIASWRAALGEDHVLLGNAHNTLGSAAYRLGDTQRAAREYGEGLRIWTAAYGQRHPEVGTAHVNLGLVAFRGGDSAGAATHYGKALAIYEAAYGPTHARVAAVLNNLGLVYRRAQDLDQAHVHFARARDVLVAVHGTDHPHLGAALNNLADIARARGELAEAERQHVEALAIYERVFGADNERVATPLLGLAAVEAERGEHRQAVEKLERALAILRPALGHEHTRVAQTMAALGSSLFALGNVEAALPLLEQAVAVHERVHSPDDQLARARFELARTVIAGDEMRGRALARAALNGLSAADPAREKVQAFLAEPGG